ncbi:hypothetical protein NUM3379_07680 [Kineococcus sp. NUM-3379]
MELAQNAADAAARAGVGGRLLLRLLPGTGGAPGTLLAANTGAPLDAAGVQGLATLRASGKRDDTGAVVGRFGLGFSAVLAVTDSPAVASRGGGVRFSRAGTLDLLAGRAASSPGLAAEVARRDGAVPVLRLPFPHTAAVPAGYDTLVELPLRDAGAEHLARELLAAADDVLLLALPALAEVVVELPGRPPRRLADVASRWHTLRRSGSHAEEALAGRGVEERARRAWELTWALPRPVDGAERLAAPGTGRPAVAGPGVLCAPTPTEEPLPWPALLLATVPLQPDRRRTAPGPARDAVLDAAAHAYVDLLVQVAADADEPGASGGAVPGAALGADVLDLVPHGLAAGEVDADLRTRVLALLPEVPLLRAVADADGAPARVRPRDAVVLDAPAGEDEAVLRALAPVLPTLVAAPRRHLPLLRLLDVTRVPLADVVEELPTHGTTPAGWARLYAALRPLAADPTAREALAALPVPLADGRVVRGPRGLVQLAAGSRVAPDALAVLAPYGLRVVHPDAAHELLELLGARGGPASALLGDPAVRAAVLASPDAEDPDELAEAVLEVVAACLPEVDGAAAVDAARELAERLPWLGELALPDSDDELAPASALALPGSLAAQVLDEAEVGLVHPELLAGRGAAPLVAVGVLDEPGTLRLAEVLVDPEDPTHDTAHDTGDDPGHDARHDTSGHDAADGGTGVDGTGVRPPGWARYLAGLAAVVEAAAEAGGPAVPLAAADVLLVRDLDLVRPDAWPRVLPVLCARPATRRALVERWALRGAGPASGGGVVLDVLGHPAWWLRRRGPLPPVTRGPAAGALLGWLDPAPGWVAELDPQVRHALGVLDEPADADPEAVTALLALSAEEARRVPPAALLWLWRLLAAHARRLAWPDGLPERLRVLDAASGGTAVVAAEDVAVADSPAWAQRSGLGPLLLVPAASAGDVAEALELDLASERAEGAVRTTGGEEVAVPAEVGVLLPGAPSSWQRAARVRVDGEDVGWWVGPDPARGPAAVCATAAGGAACGLALAAGRWELRHDVAALLAAPDAAARAAVLAAALPG